MQLMRFGMHHSSFIASLSRTAPSIPDPYSLFLPRPQVQHSRRYLRKIAKLVPSGIPVLCTSKGIDRKTLSLMCEILPSSLVSVCL